MVVCKRTTRVNTCCVYYSYIVAPLCCFVALWEAELHNQAKNSLSQLPEMSTFLWI